MTRRKEENGDVGAARLWGKIWLRELRPGSQGAVEAGRAPGEARQQRGWGRGRGLRGRRGGGSGYRAAGGGGKGRGRGAAAAELASSAGQLWRRRRPGGSGGGRTDRGPRTHGQTDGCLLLIVDRETAAVDNARPQAPRRRALPRGLTAARQRPKTGRGSLFCAEVSAHGRPAVWPRPPGPRACPGGGRGGGAGGFVLSLRQWGRGGLGPAGRGRA